MTQINKVDINKNYLSPRQTSRSYSVYGDPGAMFNITVTNSDGEYYNFPENTIIENPNTQSLPTPSYSSSPAKLNTVTIGGTGVYSSSITFEASNTEDEYTLTIYPQMHNGTTLNFGANKSSYIFAKIKQLTDSKTAFDLLSLADNSSYNAYPAHISFKGDNGRVTPVPIPSTQSISWTPTLNAGDFVLARQPLANDFYFDFVQRIYATSGGATTIEVKDISKLSIGMEVTHAHINTGAVILSITPGYYNATKSTAVFPVYDIPIVANETSPNKPTLQQDKGGTIVIDKTLAEGIADNTGVNFRGYGPKAARKFCGVNFNVTNFTCALNPVVTTTDVAVSSSATITIASTDGIKVADTTIMSGIGIVGTPHVDGVSANANVTASSTQTIENGQTITFTGSSRSATITADITITGYGSTFGLTNNTLTLNLNLDKILTVS